MENGDLEWLFVWDSPGIAALVPQELRLSPKCNVSFETLCAETERHIGSIPYLICTCCQLGEDKRCKSCMYAVGFHKCQTTPDVKSWRKGTLHAGPMDFQRVLWNLHRRGIPTRALIQKADDFVGNGDLTVDAARITVRTIEGERGAQRMANEAGGDAGDAAQGRGRVSERLTLADMQAELDKRVDMMRSGAANLGGITDQARVYDYIVAQLESGGPPLRLLIQASAGTGKSFLLTTVLRAGEEHSK